MRNHLRALVCLVATLAAASVGNPERWALRFYEWRRSDTCVGEIGAEHFERTIEFRQRSTLGRWCQRDATVNIGGAEMVSGFLFLNIFGVELASCVPMLAGMPSVLPSDYDFSATLTDLSVARLQAISFFSFVFLLSAWIVQGLWNYLARDVARMPRMSFGRAVSLVLLCGMLFAIVLTMISGARELMMPGAWERSGWTYELREREQTQ